MQLLVVFFTLLLMPGVLLAEPVARDSDGGGALHGTLEVPTAEFPAPYPVALIISGSGPTDRDGNSVLLPGQNNSLKFLAEALAANGIASFRFDKRGVAQSAGAAAKEEELRFETLIDDAVMWGKVLQGDKRLSRSFVIGHSEGSLLGMVAAQRLEADGFVSIAGIGRRADEVLLAQLRPQLPPELMKKSEEILQSLLAGKTVADVPPPLQALFRPSVQPYLISWFGYDPIAEISKLHVPVLVIQGTTDIQITVGDAQLLKKAQPEASLQIIEGMNHVLKMVAADPQQQIASYSAPALPVAPQLVKAISEFVNAAQN